MRIILKQSFPLGRFHATPWRVNPFDDPFGEWPPSPWRLIRAVCARWYQWQRETGAYKATEIDRLLSVLCNSTYRFWLPPNARRGFALRQYQPSDFGWQPPGKNKKIKTKRVHFALRSDEVCAELRRTAGVLSAVVSAKEIQVTFRTDEIKVSSLRSLLGKQEAIEDAEPLLVPISARKTFGTTLSQDNAWCIPADEADESAVWWFIEGEWSEGTSEVLDKCLERIVYFGRAETLTVIKRWRDQISFEPNCYLQEEPRSLRSIPVLSPLSDASREDVERITDDPRAKGRTVPPGAVWRYAEVPPPVSLREVRLVRMKAPNTNCIQFAVGVAVSPDPAAIARLMSHFRSRVVTNFVRLRTGDLQTTWVTAPAAVRAEAALLAGKSEVGEPLHGHRHAAFFAIPEKGFIARAVVWRPAESPFTPEEHDAVLLAAEKELSWAANGRAFSDEWKVRLIPLDPAVGRPEGFGEFGANVWESVTPYVPVRHRFRKGRLRASESLENQIRRELHLRGVDKAISATVQEFREPSWVDVNCPLSARRDREFIGKRLGHWIRIELNDPTIGPLSLGHSSHVGLGLFRPVNDLH